MANIATKILPDSKKEDDEELRLKYIRPFESSYAIGHSAVAVSQVRDEVERMRDMVGKNISAAFDTLISYDDKLRQKVGEREEYIDYLNKGISEYIVSLMASEMSMDDSRKINGYYSIVSNLERIADHAVNIRDKYFKKQMQRLKKGKCKPQSGIVFSEILTDFERMGDHVLNIAQEYKEME